MAGGGVSEPITQITENPNQPIPVSPSYVNINEVIKCDSLPITAGGNDYTDAKFSCLLKQKLYGIYARKTAVNLEGIPKEFQLPRGKLLSDTFTFLGNIFNYYGFPITPSNQLVGLSKLNYDFAIRVLHFKALEYITHHEIIDNEKEVRNVVNAINAYAEGVEIDWDGNPNVKDLEQLPKNTRNRKLFLPSLGVGMNAVEFGQYRERIKTYAHEAFLGIKDVLEGTQKHVYNTLTNQYVNADKRYIIFKKLAGYDYRVDLVKTGAIELKECFNETYFKIDSLQDLGNNLYSFEYNGKCPSLNLPVPFNTIETLILYTKKAGDNWNNTTFTTLKIKNIPKSVISDVNDVIIDEISTQELTIGDLNQQDGLNAYKLDIGDGYKEDKNDLTKINASIYNMEEIIKCDSKATNQNENDRFSCLLKQEMHGIYYRSITPAVNTVGLPTTRPSKQLFTSILDFLKIMFPHYTPNDPSSKESIRVLHFKMLEYITHPDIVNDETKLRFMVNEFHKYIDGTEVDWDKNPNTHEYEKLPFHPENIKLRLPKLNTTDDYNLYKEEIKKYATLAFSEIKNVFEGSKQYIYNTITNRYETNDKYFYKK